MSTKYKVTITTSDKTKGASTNATVKLQMVGEDGIETKWLKLDHFFRNDFEAGKTDFFTLSCDNVGLPVMIRFKLCNWIGTDEWLCDIVIIEYEGKKAEFPIYEWISDSIDVARGDGELPQKVACAVVRTMRSEEIKEKKEKFPWIKKATNPNDIGWGLPRYVDASNPLQLPKIFLRSEVRLLNFLSKGLEGAVNSISQTVQTLVRPINDLKDYHSLYQHPILKREDAMLLDDWDTDENFGRQVINGIAQPCFKRLELNDLPAGCVITSEDVEPILGCGKTLESETKAGKIFVVDLLEYFNDVPRKTHYKNKQPLNCPDCFAMFYVNDEDQFLPLAIQLVPGRRDHMFTPADSHDDWLLAKMYFRCALGNKHEWISHFLLTHGAMEPFAVALFRCLPRAHPVYKLLFPHLRTVMVINTDARIILISKNGIVSKSIATEALGMNHKIYKSFNIDDLCLPKQLEHLGLQDTKCPPNYHYREDALKLWNAVEKYVTSVLRHYYKCDSDLSNDFELQDWTKDVAQEGLGWQDGNTRGMPETMHDVDQLISICVALIFTSSVQHAAVNFGQFENYKYIPNSPLAMRLPPHKKGEATKQRILDSLPDAVMASPLITVVFTLSEYSPNEIYLGNFPSNLFTDEKVLDIQGDFREDLKQIEKEIRQRNSTLEHPYTYLLPSRVPNSIAI